MAISWWLQGFCVGTPCNQSPNNPYNVVTVYGKKDENPWQNPDVAMFIGNQLRACNYVGLYLRFPDGSSAPGCTQQAKHVITAWGDTGPNNTNELTGNPLKVKVTDSDRDGLGNPTVEEYAYQDGWYLDYMPPVASDPLLDNVVTLSPPDTNCDGTGLRVVGSYQIKQTESVAATGLHYEAWSKDTTRICTYSTKLDPTKSDVSQIVKYHTEEGCAASWVTECEYIEVDWEFRGLEIVPVGTEIEITTEFLLPSKNTISYRNVHFTVIGLQGFPVPHGPNWPGFGWSIITPGTGTPTGGGFVVGAFDLYSDSTGTTKVAEYRFQHEYDENQDPNTHYFELQSLEDTNSLYVGGLRFAHACDLLTTADLWALGSEDWIQEDSGIITLLPSAGPYELTLNWTVNPITPVNPVAWEPDPLSGNRTTRSLRFTVTGEAGPSTPEAIKVTMFNLQDPQPPNLPGNPPPNFNGYESGTCAPRTCVGGTKNGAVCVLPAPVPTDCPSPGVCTPAVESNGCTRWVGKPGIFREAQHTPLAGNYKAARLQCTPYYYDWTTEGLITVVGAEIMPSSEYSVKTYGVSCRGCEDACTNVSEPVQMLTRRSGDVEVTFNPPGTTTQPDVTDIAQLVNKFRNVSGALVKAISQLQPNLPELNADINALDIVAVVDAAKQKAYAFSGPCACPSAVTCGSTSCTTDTPCVAAFGKGSLCTKTCIDGASIGEPCINNTHCPGSTCGTGFCRDRCGRCTP